MDNKTDRVAAAHAEKERWFGTESHEFGWTDPEFAEMHDRLLYGEIYPKGTLSDRQKVLVSVVAFTTIAELDDLPRLVRAGLRLGVKPVEIREAIYQCAPYAGFDRARSALKVANWVFEDAKIVLPLPKASTVTEESRFADGLKVQKEIFGDGIDRMHETAAEGQREIIVNHLSAFCFGDIYTRGVLDLKDRELLTFCILTCLGGCEPQVKAHVQGNANVGNPKQLLVDALAQMLPRIGFPRTLNSLACVNQVLKDQA